MTRWVFMSAQSAGDTGLVESALAGAAMAARRNAKARIAGPCPDREEPRCIPALYAGSRPHTNASRTELLDYFNHAACARFNQHRRLVDDRVPVIAHAVFGRHVIVGDAGFRQHGSGAERLGISVGMRAMLANGIIAETRAVGAGEPTDCGASRRARGRTDGSV